MRAESRPGNEVCELTPTERHQVVVALNLYWFNRILPKFIVKILQDKINHYPNSSCRRNPTGSLHLKTEFYTCRTESNLNTALLVCLSLVLKCSDEGDYPVELTLCHAARNDERGNRAKVFASRLKYRCFLMQRNDRTRPPKPTRRSSPVSKRTGEFHNDEAEEATQEMLRQSKRLICLGVHIIPKKNGDDSGEMKTEKKPYAVLQHAAATSTRLHS